MYIVPYMYIPCMRFEAPPAAPFDLPAPPHLQLQRRAGIPADAASDETYAAFTVAVKEHEERLQVQCAGEAPVAAMCCSGSAVWPPRPDSQLNQSNLPTFGCRSCSCVQLPTGRLTETT